MKIAMASYGTRGDIEPSLAVGCELLRRGHDVRMAVPPDLLSFAEAAGFTAVPYGRDVEPQLDPYRDLWMSWARHIWNMQDLVTLCREALKVVTQQWEEMSKTILSFAHGADLVSTSVAYEHLVANVTECCETPLVALHTFAWRPNGQLFPILPAPLTRSGMMVHDWLGWRLTKKHEDAQRRDLCLPKATRPYSQRVIRNGLLEIQAYDEVCIPGLAHEWAKWNGQRPFVGALTMELTTEADEEVASWMAAGTPPICFAFGSIPLESPLDTVEMISAACAQLGERALVCAGGTHFSRANLADHVKVVGVVNYASVFAASRAVVHHGGSGTTAASLRAGVPTLVLWTAGDQPMWGNQLKRLKSGTARRLSTTTQESLVEDLRQILGPQYAVRAREVAKRMTEPGESVRRAADLMENFARGRKHP